MKKVSFSFRIFLLAFILRLIPIIAMQSIGIGLDDMFQYDMLARSIEKGNGFRWYALEDLKLLEPYVKFDLSTPGYDPIRGVHTSFRAPLYPFFLACIYFIAGTGSQRFLAARLAQAVLGGLLAPITYTIARGFFTNNTPEKLKRVEHIAVASAWIVACYPMLILYPFGLATENLFFLFLLLSFLFLQKMSQDHEIKIAYAVWSGFFLALTSLTRSIIIPFVGLVILWSWFILKNRKGSLVMALVFLAIIFPWILRNSLLHHKLTSIETSMGYNLYVGYHPDSNGSFTYGVSLDLIPILDDAERDRIGTQQAFSFIKNDPTRILRLAFNRLSFFFGLEKRVLLYFYSNNFMGHIPTIILFLIILVVLLPFVIMAGLAPIGIALAGRRPQTLLLWLLLFAYLLPHVLILSEDRFHLAMVPFMAILASCAWYGGRFGIHELWTERPQGKGSLLLAGIAILYANRQLGMGAVA